jgi:hypothetical protein
MKPTRKLSSYVLLAGVMGLSIVGGVVAYQIYSAAVKTQTTKEQAIAIKPLDGVINQSTLDGLRKRTVYSDIQMGLLLTATPTPEATASPVLVTPTPTPTAIPTPIAPVSTGSATLP